MLTGLQNRVSNVLSRCFKHVVYCALNMLESFRSHSAKCSGLTTRVLEGARFLRVQIGLHRVPSFFTHLKTLTYGDCRTS